MPNRDQETPAGYVCTKCAAAGLKLWREYQPHMDSTKLFCAACALIDQKRTGPVDELGMCRDRFGAKCDQIGQLFPAVPTEDNATFWGYTSTPQHAVNWWRRLPTAL